MIYNPFEDPAYKRLFQIYATDKYGRIKKTETGYHYTSLFALNNMIEEKELWLTKADFLNDNKETTYAHSIINKVISSSNYDSVIVDHIEKSVEFDKKNLNQSYILSMSSEKDNLTLWGNYSKSDGFNLEFNLNMLEKYIWGEMSLVRNNGEIYDIADRVKNQEGNYHSVRDSIRVDVVKVKYDKKDHINEVRKFCQELNAWYLKNIDNFNDKTEMNLAIAFLTKYLFDIARCYKNEIFSHEKEIRMIVSIVNYDLNKEILYHRIKENILIPYIKVKLNDLLPIHSITIGPCNRNDKAKDGIDSLLKQKGYYNYIIRKSKAPLRFLTY